MHHNFQAIVNTFTNKKPLCLGFNPEGNATISDLKARLQSITSIQLVEQRITTVGGKDLDDSAPIFNENDNFGPIVYNLSIRMIGGKGGFGSMLRAQGGRMNAQKTTNFDACRDLQGRRVKAVNDAKKLAEYLETLPEREREKAEKLKQKIEKALEAPPTKKYRFDDNKFMEDREQVIEDVKSAVSELMKNGSSSTSRQKAPKATVNVISVFDDDDEDDEENEDDDEEEDMGESSNTPSSEKVTEQTSNDTKGKGKAIDTDNADEEVEEDENEDNDDDEKADLAAFMEADLDDYDSEDDEEFEAASDESESSDDIDDDDLVDEDNISDNEVAESISKGQSSSSAAKGKGKETRKRKERDE
ncbi:telomere stability and silencing-domain-containing protein [Umbelopsis sp. PMI_123]|nr:telomere stability and silencing-domain-containing protein [Umbelopsis sp. PMI_123]